jgi:hypothetical protein
MVWLGILTRAVADWVLAPDQNLCLRNEKTPMA